VGLKKRVIVIQFKALLLLVFVVISSFVLANEDVKNLVQGATVTKGSTVRATAASVGTDTAAGGNVTNMNLTASAITSKWQGYYGNASMGSLRLGTGSSTNLYSWSGSLKNNIVGVFATTGSDFNFGYATQGTAQSYDLALGFIDNGVYWSDADTVLNTMTNNNKNNVFGNIMGNFFSVANLTSYAFENNVWSNISSKFSVGVFVDRSDSNLAQTDFAVGVNVSNGPYRSFDNQTNVNYELMVPLNASSASVGQTYYFYLAVK